MAKLLFLGSGSAFTVGTDNYQSNMFLISERGRRLLLDCGSDIRFSLHREGFSHRDVTDVYISHLHADHVGGLEYVGLSCKFDPQCTKPNLYTSQDLVQELWASSLAGGMRAIQGDVADLATFFRVHPIGQDRKFVWEEFEIELVRVVHVDTGYYLMPSYGLFITMAERSIFVTTDTQLDLPSMLHYYKRADLIFQDCETLPVPTTVHAHYPQLCKLPPAIKGKMWLYGHQPIPEPDAIADGFLGFVQRGQLFDLVGDRSGDRDRNIVTI